MTDLYGFREPLLNAQGQVVANRLCFDPPAQGLSGERAMEALGRGLDHLRTVRPADDNRHKPLFVLAQGVTVDAALLTWLSPPPPSSPAAPLEPPAPLTSVVLEIGSSVFSGPAGVVFGAALRQHPCPLCLHHDDQAERAFSSGAEFRFIGFELDAFSPARLRHLVARTAGHGMPVAFGVSSAAAFKTCLQAGIGAAAGWFFLHPATAANARQGPPPRLQPSHHHLIRVLNLVRHNANISEVEHELKQDVALSYKLLRYINSAGFGLGCEIQSFRHAVSILGYDKLNRWLALLLATAGSAPLAPALLHTALVRARQMELLGHGLVDPGEYDNLFITGAFSLLDRMLGVSMEEVLAPMHLPPAITDALLERGGLYAPFLDLARAQERPDVADIARQASALGLGPVQLNRALFDGIAFADRLDA